MGNVTNSHSLTSFQRDARRFIEGLNQTREPLLLTVNGTVQAVVVDMLTYQELEEERESKRFIAAIEEGEADIQAGRVGTMEELKAEIKTKYGF
ncbi:MAG: type II toxin-antitoxin system Phd/YefM family antitoxin [Abditibacteriaceae bacterium]